VTRRGESRHASPGPRQQLDGFIDKYTPNVAALAQQVLIKMRQRLPGAIELVYDNYNALAIGFGPTERASDAIFSIALFPRWVSLYFLHGADLPDPQKVLKGTGRQARHIVLEVASDLDRPPVRKLMECGLASAAKPLDRTSRRRIVIKSISKKQRPRRPGPAKD
jgi:hypothetical protein